MSSDFGSGFDEGGWFQAWPFDGFKRQFTAEVMKHPCAIRAIIYRMGGPLPCCIESYEFKASPSEIRIYVKRTANGLCSHNQINSEGEAVS